MSPLAELDQLYRIFSPNRSLENDIGWYLARHYVFSTPHLIVLGKPVKKGAHEEQFLDVEYVFPTDDIDTWFLFAYAGTERDFLAFIPFKLTWIAWQRYGCGMRYWTLQHFINRCKAKIPCTIAGWDR